MNSKTEILNKINEILKQSTSNVLIVIPKLKDIESIHLYELKSSTSIRIACKVDYLEIFNELTSLDNIKIRNYVREDRYGIIRDNEEFFLAIPGEDKDNFLTFYTNDTKHIRIINILITECWISGTIVENEAARVARNLVVYDKQYSKIFKEFDEKEWEEFQKEIKEIDKKIANTAGVNIISKIISINKIIYIKKEKEVKE